MTALSEREWQRQVTDLAELLGWSWAHWRPAMTTRGWRTPVSGPLGAGFPDLLLVHPRRGAVLLVELKADRGRLSPEQRDVHDLLRAAGLDLRTWRPRDWDEVAATLSTPTRPTGSSRTPHGAISTGGDRPAGGRLPSPET